MTTNIDIASDLNVGGNLTVDGQLNLYDMILASPTIGFSLYGNDSQGYPTINFFSGDPSTGTLQYSMGVYNDIFYIIPNGGSQAFQVNSSNDVDIPYNLTVGGTSTLTGDVNVNGTFTVSHAYLGYIDTLVYMQNGASFYGPLNILDQAGSNIFTITVNSSNQLQIASSGETNPILVSDTSNNVNFPGNLSVGGTSTLTGAVTASTINATTINLNPSVATAQSSEVYYVQPFAGPTYKKAIFVLVSFSGGIDIDYPVAFASYAYVTAKTANITASATLTYVHLTS